MPIFGQPTSDKPRHPSSSWANWKNGKFIAWNRDKQEEEEITLPKEFVVIAESYSIKGFLQDKGGVWSNEIYSFANDPFTIRANNGEILYEGLWKDIKDKVKALGLKVTTNVHYIDPKKTDVLRTFCVKWAASQEWMNSFSNENRNAEANNTVTLKEVKDGKTWSVTYTYPSFAAVKPLTPEQRNLQQEWGAKLITYKNEVTESEEPEEAPINKYDDDNLPF